MSRDGNNIIRPSSFIIPEEIMPGIQLEHLEVAAAYNLDLSGLYEYNHTVEFKYFATNPDHVVDLYRAAQGFRSTPNGRLILNAFSNDTAIFGNPFQTVFAPWTRAQVPMYWGRYLPEHLYSETFITASRSYQFSPNTMLIHLSLDRSSLEIQKLLAYAGAQKYLQAVTGTVHSHRLVSNEAFAMAYRRDMEDWFRNLCKNGENIFESPRLVYDNVVKNFIHRGVSRQIDKGVLVYCEDGFSLKKNPSITMTFEAFEEELQNILRQAQEIDIWGSHSQKWTSQRFIYDALRKNPVLRLLCPSKKQLNVLISHAESAMRSDIFANLWGVEEALSVGAGSIIAPRTMNCIDTQVLPNPRNLYVDNRSRILAVDFSSLGGSVPPGPQSELPSNSPPKAGPTHEIPHDPSFPPSGQSQYVSTRATPDYLLEHDRHSRSSNFSYPRTNKKPLPIKEPFTHNGITYKFCIDGVFCGPDEVSTLELYQSYQSITQKNNTQSNRIERAVRTQRPLILALSEPLPSADPSQAASGHIQKLPAALQDYRLVTAEGERVLNKNIQFIRIYINDRFPVQTQSSIFHEGSHLFVRSTGGSFDPAMSVAEAEEFVVQYYRRDNPYPGFHREKWPSIYEIERRLRTFTSSSQYFSINGRGIDAEMYRVLCAPIEDHYNGYIRRFFQGLQNACLRDGMDVFSENFFQQKLPNLLLRAEEAARNGSSGAKLIVQELVELVPELKDRWSWGNRVQDYLKVHIEQLRPFDHEARALLKVEASIADLVERLAAQNLRTEVLATLWEVNELAKLDLASNTHRFFEELIAKRHQENQALLSNGSSPAAQSQINELTQLSNGLNQKKFEIKPLAQRDIKLQPPSSTVAKANNVFRQSVSLPRPLNNASVRYRYISDILDDLRSQAPSRVPFSGRLQILNRRLLNSPAVQFIRRYGMTALNTAGGVLLGVGAWHEYRLERDLYPDRSRGDALVAATGITIVDLGAVGAVCLVSAPLGIMFIVARTAAQMGPDLYERYVQPLLSTNGPLPADLAALRQMIIGPAGNLPLLNQEHINAATLTHRIQLGETSLPGFSQNPGFWESSLQSGRILLGMWQRNLRNLAGRALYEPMREPIREWLQTEEVHHSLLLVSDGINIFPVSSRTHEALNRARENRLREERWQRERPANSHEQVQLDSLPNPPQTQLLTSRGELREIYRMESGFSTPLSYGRPVYDNNLRPFASSLRFEPSLPPMGRHSYGMGMPLTLRLDGMHLPPSSADWQLTLGQRQLGTQAIDLTANSLLPWASPFYQPFSAQQLAPESGGVSLNPNLEGSSSERARSALPSSRELEAAATWYRNPSLLDRIDNLADQLQLRPLPGGGMGMTIGDIQFSISPDNGFVPVVHIPLSGLTWGGALTGGIPVLAVSAVMSFISWFEARAAKAGMEKLKEHAERTERDIAHVFHDIAKPLQAMIESGEIYQLQDVGKLDRWLAEICDKLQLAVGIKDFHNGRKHKAIDYINKLVKEEKRGWWKIDPPNKDKIAKLEATKQQLIAFYDSAATNWRGLCGGIQAIRTATSGRLLQESKVKEVKKLIVDATSRGTWPQELVCFTKEQQEIAYYLLATEHNDRLKHVDEAVAKAMATQNYQAVFDEVKPEDYELAVARLDSAFVEQFLSRLDKNTPFSELLKICEDHQRKLPCQSTITSSPRFQRLAHKSCYELAESGDLDGAKKMAKQSAELINGLGKPRTTEHTQASRLTFSQLSKVLTGPLKDYGPENSINKENVAHEAQTKKLILADPSLLEKMSPKEKDFCVRVLSEEFEARDNQYTQLSQDFALKKISFEELFKKVRGSDYEEIFQRGMQAALFNALVANSSGEDIYRLYMDALSQCPYQVKHYHNTFARVARAHVLQLTGQLKFSQAITDADQQVAAMDKTSLNQLKACGLIDKKEYQALIASGIDPNEKVMDKRRKENEGGLSLYEIGENLHALKQQQQQQPAEDLSEKALENTPGQTVESSQKNIVEAPAKKTADDSQLEVKFTTAEEATRQNQRLSRKTQLQFHNTYVKAVISILMDTFGEDYLRSAENGKGKMVMQAMKISHLLVDDLAPMVSQYLLSRLFLQRILPLHHDWNLSANLIKEIGFDNFKYQHRHLIQALTRGLPQNIFGGLSLTGEVSGLVSTLSSSLLVLRDPASTLRIDRDLRYVARSGQMLQMGTMVASSTRKLITEGMEIADLDTVAPLANLGGMLGLRAWESWYKKHHHQQMPEDLLSHILRDNIVNILPQLISQWKNTPPLGEAGDPWVFFWLVAPRIVKPLFVTGYKLYYNHYRDEQELTRLMNIQLLLEQEHASASSVDALELREYRRDKLDQLPMAQQAYDEKDRKAVKNVKRIAFESTIGDALSSHQDELFLELTELKKIGDNLFIGKNNLPITEYIEGYFLLSRLDKLVNSLKPQSNMSDQKGSVSIREPGNVLREFQKLFRAPEMKKMLSNPPRSYSDVVLSYLDRLQTAGNLFLASHKFKEVIALVDLVPWSKHPHHDDDMVIVRQLKSLRLTAQLKPLIPDQSQDETKSSETKTQPLPNRDKALQFTELEYDEKTRIWTMNADGQNVPLHYFDYTVMSETLQCREAYLLKSDLDQEEQPGTDQPTSQKLEAGRFAFAALPLRYIQNLFPEWTWRVAFSEEKSFEKRAYFKAILNTDGDTSSRLSPATEFANHCNIIFNLVIRVFYKWPEQLPLPKMEVVQSGGHHALELRHVPVEFLSQLITYQWAVKKLQQALKIISEYQTQNPSLLLQHPLDLPLNPHSFAVFGEAIVALKNSSLGFNEYYFAALTTDPSSAVLIAHDLEALSAPALIDDLKAIEKLEIRSALGRSLQNIFKRLYEYPYSQRNAILTPAVQAELLKHAQFAAELEKATYLLVAGWWGDLTNKLFNLLLAQPKYAVTIAQAYKEAFSASTFDATCPIVEKYPQRAVALIQSFNELAVIRLKRYSAFDEEEAETETAAFFAECLKLFHLQNIAEHALLATNMLVQLSNLWISEPEILNESITSIRKYEVYIVPLAMAVDILYRNNQLTQKNFNFLLKNPKNAVSQAQIILELGKAGEFRKSYQQFMLRVNGNALVMQLQWLPKTKCNLFNLSINESNWPQNMENFSMLYGIFSNLKEEKPLAIASAIQELSGLLTEINGNWRGFNEEALKCLANRGDSRFILQFIRFCKDLPQEMREHKLDAVNTVSQISDHANELIEVMFLLQHNYQTSWRKSQRMAVDGGYETVSVSYPEHSSLFSLANMVAVIKNPSVIKTLKQGITQLQKNNELNQAWLEILFMETEQAEKVGKLLSMLKNNSYFERVVHFPGSISEFVTIEERAENLLTDEVCALIKGQLIDFLHLIPAIELFRKKQPAISMRQFEFDILLKNPKEAPAVAKALISLYNIKFAGKADLFKDPEIAAHAKDVARIIIALSSKNSTFQLFAPRISEENIKKIKEHVNNSARVADEAERLLKEGKLNNDSFNQALKKIVPPAARRDDIDRRKSAGQSHARLDKEQEEMDAQILAVETELGGIKNKQSDTRLITAPPVIEVKDNQPKFEIDPSVVHTTASVPENSIPEVKDNQPKPAVGFQDKSSIAQPVEPDCLSSIKTISPTRNTGLFKESNPNREAINSNLENSFS